jgi:hypothetical protein
MKKLLLIIPLALSSAACVPVYGSYAPPAGYPPPYRSPYQPAPSNNPGPVGRWSNVMMLPPGAEIAVVSDDGRLTLGNFMAATNAFVRLAARSGEVEIPANAVTRVDWTRGGGNTMARDALAGGAFGVGAVGLMGLAGGRMPPARLFAAGAIFAAYESAQWGRQLKARSTVTVYLAPPPAIR